TSTICNLSSGDWESSIKQHVFQSTICNHIGYRWRIGWRCYTIVVPTEIHMRRHTGVAIVVIGAGAIGLLVAGQLANSGQPTILLARPAVAAAIEQQRLRVLQDGVLHVAEG